MASSETNIHNATEVRIESGYWQRLTTLMEEGRWEDNNVQQTVGKAPTAKRLVFVGGREERTEEGWSGESSEANLAPRGGELAEQSRAKRAKGTRVEEMSWSCDRTWGKMFSREASCSNQMGRGHVGLFVAGGRCRWILSIIDSTPAKEEPHPHPPVVAKTMSNQP